ncbi:hypothetical protein [Candidatus Leptofilum sp.]|uniref:hypothetical protein n=1 Tax=Candidatus Leptofilum sp. TaxID=3241576 RepID=UPI003B5C37AC
MVEIWDDTLKDRKNSCLITHKNDILNEVLSKLIEVGGKNWWHLIVDWDNEEFRATNFEDLAAQLENAPEYSVLEPLHSFDIPVVKSIDKYSMGTAAALKIAYQQPQKLVIVTEKGIPVGLLYVGSKRTINFEGKSIRDWRLIIASGEYIKKNQGGNIEFDRKKILQSLTTYFSEDDLRTLCFLIKVNFDELPGNDTRSKARELCLYCERRGKTAELINEMKNERPNMF